jgi:hypothetical protein
MDGDFILGQLQKKTAQQCEKQILKVAFVLVELQVSKDKSRPCIFFYIENVC